MYNTVGTTSQISIRCDKGGKVWLCLNLYKFNIFSELARLVIPNKYRSLYIPLSVLIWPLIDLGSQQEVFFLQRLILDIK